MDWLYFGELAINGALTGLMYSLCALGLVLIYKTSGVANLAQGALIMTGGYLVAWLVSGLGFPLLLAILAGLAWLFLMGFLIERLALRTMIGQPVIMIIMLTLGIEILLRGLVPALGGTGLQRLDLGIPAEPIIVADMFINRAYLSGGAVALAAIALAALFFRSRRGVVLRAVSDDQPASWAVGIRVERAIALSWGLAGMTALLAGVLWGSVQGVDWTLSLLLIKALAVAILGGLDSILGALVAGLALGVAESVIPGYLDPIAGGGTRDVVASFAILLTTIVRPFGLFGREHIERI
ncbi:MAG: branched-chain amino acid ABC transporter permease [Rhodomicrobium sp.]